MKKFSTEANGYNRQEVNDFIGDVIVQTEGIIKRCRSQNTEIEKLRAELEHYRAIEETLRISLVKAEENSSSIKEMARNESEMIINDAKNNASRIVNEALLKADKIESNADMLERNMKIYKRKLKIILEQQKAVVDEIEVLELER